MKITEKVILDLLPVYLADEASQETRELVEAYLAQNEGLAQRVREMQKEALPGPGVGIPPELELRSLRRTRRRIRAQRWLFGLALFFTALLLSNQFTIEAGRLKEFHFLLQDWPVVGVACLALAVGFWVAYVLVGRNLRRARV
jgi:hypothetical protein